MTDFTKKHEEELYQAILNGADSCTQMAECLGITVNEFKNLRYFPKPVQNQKLREKREKIKATISTIIKEATEERRIKRVKAARDGIMQLVAPTPYIDKTVEVKEFMQDGKKVRETKTKEVTKNYAPNVTACIFELCNSDKENYQSINKASIEIGEDSKGLIAKYFDEMDKK